MANHHFLSAILDLNFAILARAAPATGSRGSGKPCPTVPTPEQGPRTVWTGIVPSALAVLSLLTLHPAKAGELVPFVIPAEIDPGHTIWIAEHQPIAVDSEHIVVRDNHFHRNAKRVRIWGVNLSFGANFPTHEDARQVAIRLAAAGVNSVRCHHMDTARWPRGIWNAEDGRTLAPEALDRLDFFINELAQRGIYVNINLHVGRAHSEYLGLPATNRDYDKMCDIFTPALVEAQKQYARDLLGHVNAYRHVRYADDPAVAFVEISNEDSLFMWGAEETLRTLPTHYAKILQGQFGSWLQRRYGSNDALRTAWAKETQPLGDTMLQNGDFNSWNAGGNTPRDWNLEQHEACRASLSLSQRAMRIAIDNADDTGWHLQITQGGLALTEGRYYTVSFEAAAERPRRITCSVGQAHEPWNNLGFSREVQLTNEMKRFSFGFVATAHENNARISFAFSGNTTPFSLARVELRSGGQVGLANDESLNQGTVMLYRNNESQPRILDRMMFLAETEKAYFDGMRDLIRNDLHCKALVTGTVVFGPLGQYAQSDMDYIDSHAYWQHPRFPGRPWDPGNWTVEQKPMTDYPEEATLFRIAAERLAGKPFTLSEYNHPAPLDAQAECVPMVASFAAAQDWDGVWLYTYSHSGDDWDRKHLNSYFDIDTNPAKWGFMRAGAAIFRHPWIARLNSIAFVRFAEPPESLAKFGLLHLQYDRDMFAILAQGWLHPIKWQSMLECIYLPSYAHESVIGSSTADDCAAIKWSVDQGGKGLYYAHSLRAQVSAGHAQRFAEMTNGRISITSPEFATVAITPLEDREHVLIAACGRCENTGMQFSKDRRTVGRNWGQAPAQIEPVEGRVVLYGTGWTCQALAPDGSPKQPVPITYENDRGILELSPRYATMWYLLRRGE